jgi:hypothetical protein
MILDIHAVIFLTISTLIHQQENKQGNCHKEAKARTQKDNNTMI